MSHSQVSPAKPNVVVKSLQPIQPAGQQMKLQQQFVRPEPTLQFLVPTTSQSQQMLILQPGTAIQPGAPLQLQLAPAPTPPGPRLVRLPLLVPSQPIIRPPTVRFIATSGSPVSSS